ncbi:endonuclease/exonuclease/phosphatase family protein [Aestuariimicrobium soli]|uniref:endonuclease/exonuclease/phosphatase family protein n=1 Tax=Aestuariimicrobium soli TaxID=2035834 RepID=UPI003EBC72B3
MATLDVMTVNLRTPVRGVEADDPDHWPTRLPAAIEVLRQRRPAVVGTQEGCDPQWELLLAELPHYQRIGTGRERGQQGEYSAILVDTDVLDVADWSQFTLSETPDELGSRSWDSSCTRIAVIADLVVRATGERFTVANTHLDHVSEEARVQGCRLIRSRLPRRATIVTGDFNCAAGEARAWHEFTEDGFGDAFLATVDGDLGRGVDTFHGYSEPGVESDLPVWIDWILASSDVGVGSSEIVTDRPGGVWPSDHWPVVATLTIPS